MSDVDRLFDAIVNPWWDRNRVAEAPDFDALRSGIASYSALCRHAAWNEIGRWFIKGKGGGEQRELLGLQCLVQALLSSPTNDSAAWTAFSGSPRPELAGIQSRLSRLPRRSESGDIVANRPLIDDLTKILGEPGIKPGTGPAPLSSVKMGDAKVMFSAGDVAPPVQAKPRSKWWEFWK